MDLQPVSLQAQIGCFVDGECTQSLNVHLNTTHSVEECLAYCQVRKLFGGSKVLTIATIAFP